MNFIVKYFKYKSFEKLTNKAVELLYTEYIDFEDAIDSFKNKYNLIETLVALKIASSINEPLQKRYIKIGFKLINEWQTTYDEKQLAEFINNYKEDVEISWMEKILYIMQGSVANIKNKQSYEGTIFELEKNNKGPISSKEKEKWKELCENIRIAEENHSKVLKEVNDFMLNMKENEAFEAIKKEVEEKQQLFGKRSNEDILSERKEILKNIKDKIDNIDTEATL